MENSIKIDVPEGYEIDKEKSTFEQIVLKKKDTKPRSWSEYCKSNNMIHKYLICEYSDIICCDYSCAIDENTDKNLIGSEEEAKAFLALMQLRLLRKAWIKDWKPDYCVKSKKWHIHFSDEQCRVSWDCHMQRTLSFPSQEIAIEFLNCFRDLIEKAKVLL